MMGEIHPKIMIQLTTKHVKKMMVNMVGVVQGGYNRVRVRVWG
jgi:hypothetical protein